MLVTTASSKKRIAGKQSTAPRFISFVLSTKIYALRLGASNRRYGVSRFSGHVFEGVCKPISNSSDLRAKMTMARRAIIEGLDVIAQVRNRELSVLVDVAS